MNMECEVLELPFAAAIRGCPKRPTSLREELEAFRQFGTPTRRMVTRCRAPGNRVVEVDTFVNEFWTARQRQASSLHEVAYRACFKPQLPRFFIERFTQPGDIVYDPFMGRGTTPIEAALLGRVPWGNDINPLSVVLTRPRLRPPTLAEIAARLKDLPLADHDEFPEDLLVFYHPDTLREICALKKYFLSRRAEGSLDAVDEWLCMVSLNRLTGHSAGFFSVYTMPPNQAVSVKSQRKINERRQQVPPRRPVKPILLKKSRLLLGDCTPAVRRTLASLAGRALLLTEPAARTPQIPSDSVSLIVTSPPFLNVVQYATDNWLRCWFLDIDAQQVQLTTPHDLEEWEAAMAGVFRELRRALQPGGHVAFEVGEVHGGETKLEERALPCGVAAGLEPVLVMVNKQQFTKTANCWGVRNNTAGTNTNRILVFRKG